MRSDKINPTVTKDQPAAAEDDYREPTKEELLEDLRIALRDAIAGEEGIPAREAIEAMRKRIYGDAHHG